MIRTTAETPPDLCDWTAVDLLEAMRSRRISPVALVRSCLNRIEDMNGAINAVVTVDEERALTAAQQIEEAISDGRSVGPLAGLPILVKDTEDTAGLRTTYGSAMFADHVPGGDLGVIGRLRSAGAIILGKTNTPEWAAGGNTRNVVHGATGNPFDPSRTAAGSSGGSAAALACGMAPLATGSDTGGSLRNPAAYCGVVGLRPSSGVVANERRLLGWSNLPVNGPMARNVRDVALMLSIMAGPDSRDPLSLPLSAASTERLQKLRPTDLSQLKASFSEDLGFAPTEQHVRRVFRDRAAVMENFFHSSDGDHPDCTGADQAFAVLRAVTFLAKHGQDYRKNPELLGPNVRANVEEGLNYTLADFAEAAAVQTRICRNFVDFFSQTDVLITPSITLSPRPWRELFPNEIDGQPTSSYFHWLALAYGITLAGNPAISVPCGVDEAGMPFGIQIVAARGADLFLLEAALAIEHEFTSDEELRRPIPDLDALACAPPIRNSPHFRSWE